MLVAGYEAQDAQSHSAIKALMPRRWWMSFIPGGPDRTAHARRLCSWTSRSHQAAGRSGSKEGFRSAYLGAIGGLRSLVAELAPDHL